MHRLPFFYRGHRLEEGAQDAVSQDLSGAIYFKITDVYIVFLLHDKTGPVCNLSEVQSYFCRMGKGAGFVVEGQYLIYPSRYFCY